MQQRKPRKKIEKINEIKNTDFYGQVIPDLKHLTATVKTKIKKSILGEEIISYEENFEINININDVHKSKALELKEALEKICKREMYLYQNKFFSYYTYDLEEEEKKKRFSDIVNCITSFDSEYSVENLIDVKDQEKFLNRMKNDGNIIHTNDYIYVYVEEKNILAIVAKTFLGNDKFTELVKSSVARDKVKFTDLVDVLDKKYLNKTAFIYTMFDYKMIESKLNEEMILEKEKKVEDGDIISSNKIKFEEMNYSKKNWANFFIEFDEVEQGFFVYLAGYKEKASYNRFSGTFNPLEKLVRELVVINDVKNRMGEEILREEELEEYKKTLPFKAKKRNIYVATLYNNIIPELDINQEKSKRMRWFVPVSSYKELKMLRDKYMLYEHIFTKKLEKMEYEENVSPDLLTPFINDIGECSLFVSKGGESLHYINLTLPEFNEIKAAYTFFDDSFADNQKEWDRNLEKAVSKYSDTGKDILENAMRRAELKHMLSEKELPVKRKKKI